MQSVFSWVFPPLDKFKSLMESWGLSKRTLVPFHDDEAPVNDGWLMKRTRGRDRNKWMEFIYISWEDRLQSVVIADRVYILSRLEKEQDPTPRGITCTGTFRCKCFISESAEILMSPRSHQHVPCITMRPCAVVHVLFHLTAIGFFFFNTE